MKTRSRLLVTLRSTRIASSIKVFIRGFRTRTIITRRNGLYRVVRVVIMVKMRLIHGRSGRGRGRKIWRILLGMVGMRPIIPMVGVLGVVKGVGGIFYTL